VHLQVKILQVVEGIVGRPCYHVRARLEEERAVIHEERGEEQGEELEGYDSALAHRPLARGHAVGTLAGGLGNEPFHCLERRLHDEEEENGALARALTNSDRTAHLRVRQASSIGRAMGPGQAFPTGR